MFLQMMNETEFQLAIALLIGIFTLVVFYLIFGRSRSKQPNILLVGCCDAGKTLLYSQLVLQTYKMSHTSLKENKGDMKLGDAKAQFISIVDIPGHERIRYQILERYRNTARAIILVVDSSTIAKDIKDVAELMYLLLTDDVLAYNKTPILVACNKQDLTYAKAFGVIRSMLEKELNTVRRTRAAALEGTDGIRSTRRELGRSSQEFEFSHLLPHRVDFVECSAKGKSLEGDSPDLTTLRQWIADINK